MNTKIKRVIDGTSNLMEFDEKMKKSYAELDKDVKEIKIELTIGSHNGGKNNVQLQQGVLIKCKSVHFQIVNLFLVNMSNTNYFGEIYNVIPRTVRGKIKQEEYNSLLQKHNETVRKLQSIRL